MKQSVNTVNADQLTSEIFDHFHSHLGIEITYSLKISVSDIAAMNS